jgi:hypothetical protein
MEFDFVFLIKPNSATRTRRIYLVDHANGIQVQCHAIAKDEETLSIVHLFLRYLRPLRCAPDCCYIS